ncbi:MAG: DNA-3-methyladenine glycosylase I [Bacteroidota bacterium]
MERCSWCGSDPLYVHYHDTEWGVPERDARALWEKLILDGFQAGLSWITILKKREGFRRAYSGFNIDAVAAYGEDDRARLLADAGIVRNKLKVNAAIENARTLQRLRAEHGSFADWLDLHHPLPKAEWVKLFKRTFKFTGDEITGEFLMSLGYLPGAHTPDCPVYAKVAALDPPWMQAERAA